MYKNMMITSRDIKIFEILKKFGWVRVDNIAKFLGLDYSDKKTVNVMNIVSGRLKRFEYIHKNKIIADTPMYWSLNKEGAKFINGVVSRKASLATLRHNDFVCELGVDFMLKGFEIKTEYELKQAVHGRLAKNKKLPDMVLDGKFAVEVELSVKDSQRLAVIVSQYVTSNYEKVIYYTSEIIADRIRALIGNSNKFEFRIFSNHILSAVTLNVESNANVSAGTKNYATKQNSVLAGLGFYKDKSAV